MSFFQLPIIPIQYDINRLFDVSFLNEPNNPIINKTMFSYLVEIKKQIDSKKILWEKYKTINNPYEYIHSVIPNTKLTICKIVPSSKTFFKIIEIINLLDLFNEMPLLKCNTFHLIEGENNGYIEATNYMRQNKNDTHYLMTNNPNKLELVKSTNSNIIYEKGYCECSNNKNIININNLIYCYNKYNGIMDFITADNNNDDELNNDKILFNQIAFAISMQNVGGIFLLKIFNIFSKSSIDMIYFLSILYQKVYIVKPNICNFTSSEKYIVCKGFRIDNKEYKDKIVSKMIDIINTCNKKNNHTNFMEKIFNIDIPCYYLNKMEEYNAIICQQQIEYIFSILNMNINKNINYNITYLHIQQCIEWCKKNKLPYNKI